MNVTRFATRAALSATAAAVAAVGVAAPAQAATGTRSLASVLQAGQSGFDTNAHDYDVLRNAIKTVLKAKPSSKVAVLADGTVALTAFLPSDAAFKELVRDITKKTPASERAAYDAVVGLGVDTVESVLLYHVVPGATLTKHTVLGSDNAVLKTAGGGTVRVDVQKSGHTTTVVLVDADTGDRDPRAVAFDINKGNRQIAHGIDRVLRPVDLP